MQESDKRILHAYVHTIIVKYIHTCMYVCKHVAMYICTKCGYQLYVYLSRIFQEINSTLGEANITTELVVPQENPHHLASIVVSWTIRRHIRARKTHKLANVPKNAIYMPTLILTHAGNRQEDICSWYNHSNSQSIPLSGTLHASSYHSSIHMYRLLQYYFI